MRLLFSANSFYPAVGGYERVAFILAQQMAARGHVIKMITFTPSSGPESELPFEVYRRPGIRTIVKLLQWSEIYIQHNVSLRLLWPIFFCWRPLACVHHGFYISSRNKTLSWRWRLKQLVTLVCTNISVSQAVADTIPGKSHVIANPYSDDRFYRVPNVAKTRDLFFVGRIVSDKGLDLLIEAIARLRYRGLDSTATIAGSGPEESAVRNRVKDLCLEDLVSFVGRVPDEKLNELLNMHRIMIVPTREGEGFGVVALEGIACGCVVVGSNCGGLPEAIGPCGRIFQTGDSVALADVLYDLLTTPESWTAFLCQAKAHLDAHRPSVVANKYSEVLTEVVERSNGKRRDSAAT
jgi:glycosyltransferase involved in cell wall biosynthesis